jgi:dienelactone hydrolase
MTRSLFSKSLASLLGAAACAPAQYQGPVPALASGYGAPGTDSVLVESIPNSHWSDNPIYVFHPAGRTAPVPTVLYSHGYGGNDTLYQIELLRHIASRGMAAVFVPYRTLVVTVEERYATLLDGFVDAARALPGIIDTTRLGFFGHSFGGGATPYLAHRLLVGKGWGSRGSFLYLSAPWYSLDLGDTVLANFPRDCPLLTVLYADDTVNDHRLGMDVFRNIAIPDSLKDLLLVRSDTVSGYVYQADHNLPSQYSPVAGEYDALDSRVTFRLLDALADFAFAGSHDGRKVSLGGGDSAQVSPGGGLAPLEETDSPAAIWPKERYECPCDTAINPRRSSCEASTGIRSPRRDRQILSITRVSPGRLRVEGGSDEACDLRTIDGQLVARSRTAELDVSALRPGLYLLRTDDGNVLRYLHPGR